MTLTDYSENAARIIVDDLSNVQIFDVDDSDVTNELVAQNVLVSTGIIAPDRLAVYIANYINQARIFDVDAQAILSTETELTSTNDQILTTQPISRQTEREARDILRERNALLVSYARFSDNRSDYWTALTKFNALQDAFKLGSYIPTGLGGVIVDAVKYTEPTALSSAVDMDGFFNSENLEQAAIFKGSFVVICSRWFKCENV